MTLPNLNPAALIVATLASFVSGFAWFGPKTFFPVWWRLMGRSPKEAPGGKTPMGLVFGSVLVGQLLQVVTLALVIGALRDAGVVAGATDGALVGLLLGFGIAAGSSLTHRLFAGHGFAVWIIEVGNDIVNAGIAGAILGGWS